MGDRNDIVCPGPVRLTDRAYPVPRRRNDQLSKGLETVAEAVPMALVHNGISPAVVPATPAGLEDFPLGFSHAEGIVGHHCEVYDQYAGIEVRLTIASARMFRSKERRRRLAGRTGGDLCGTETPQEVCRRQAPVGDGHTVAPEVLRPALPRLPGQQHLFQATGAVHAAWTDLKGVTRLIREHVGRHNALDKLVGATAAMNQNPQTGFVAATCHPSYEMAQKAASAGLCMLAPISASTGRAIHLAEQAGLTRAGFARKGGHAIYSYPQRVHPDAAVPNITHKGEHVMNAEHLVKMANDIGDFFAAQPDRDEAMRDIASHLKRFWNPEMRHTIVAYVDEHQGEGLKEIVYKAIECYRSNLCGAANVPAHDMWSRPQGGSDAG